jgi:hypothetical protein
MRGERFEMPLNLSSPRTLNNPNTSVQHPNTVNSINGLQAFPLLLVVLTLEENKLGFITR